MLRNRKLTHLIYVTTLSSHRPLFISLCDSAIAGRTRRYSSPYNPVHSVKYNFSPPLIDLNIYLTTHDLLHSKPLKISVMLKMIIPNYSRNCPELINISCF